jgi:hypothetical protein
MLALIIPSKEFMTFENVDVYQASSNWWIVGVVEGFEGLWFIFGTTISLFTMCMSSSTLIIQSQI